MPEQINNDKARRGAIRPMGKRPSVEVHPFGEPLRPGDLITLQHGPFEAVWEVESVNEIGALLHYAGRVKFTGYPAEGVAPNGTHLTDHPHQGFIGRAHWHSARRAT